MGKETKALYLTEEQLDAVEEAADIMALGNIFTDTYEEAVHYLVKWYIEQNGPGFEGPWHASELDSIGKQGPRTLSGMH